MGLDKFIVFLKNLLEENCTLTVQAQLLVGFSDLRRP